MKQIVCSIIFLLSFIFSPLFTPLLYSQKYHVHCEITGYKGNRAYLAALRGDDVKMIDSVAVSNGNINLQLNGSDSAGMYRIFFVHPSRSGMFDRDIPYLDFIFNHEDIALLTSFEAPLNDIVVTASEENKAYFKFIRQRNMYRQKLGLLLSLIQVYPPEDNFFNEVYDELIKLQKTYDDSLVQMAGIHPDWFSSSLILFQREPLYDPVRYPDLDKFMQENFLKPVNFNDPRLINSQEITRKIISYLGFFREDVAGQEAQETAFIHAVDNIMNEVMYDESIHEFVLNYLIDGFERFQMERVLVHIADSHLSGECKTENEEIIKDRLEAYKRMAPGNTVPDISLLDPFNEAQRLSELKNQTILLIFWSTECPHCANLLPRLAKWYKDEGGSHDIGIYAVSIDKNKADWEEFVLLNDLHWTNVFDPGGWESKTSRRFNLYATPTMFLLNNDLKIISKPITFREFKNDIEGL